MPKNYFDMNRQQRYEPVPQRDEVIILDSISSPNYNYNTALPTSVASSSHNGDGDNHPSHGHSAPSIISIPNSPPPSFHTHSSPGTPRPSHRQMAQTQQQYSELWGVAPSTIGGETTINSSNDALATISGLKQRVEWLEESLGRLLLEKEANKNNPNSPDGDNDSDNHRKRDNCCVVFTDASPDLESALIKSRGTNCCVAYSGSKSEAKRKEQQCALIAAVFVFLVLCGVFAIVMTAKSGRVNRAVNGAVDHAVRMME